MKILLLFATYTGSTALASEYIKQNLEESDQDVVMKDVAEVSESDLAASDLIIFGSPSWGNGEPHLSYEQFRTQFAHLMKDKACAVFGLGDSSFPEFCKAVTVLEEMIATSNGKLLRPSLRIDRFLENEVQEKENITSWLKEILHTIS